MAIREQDDIPYRSPVQRTAPSAPEPSSVDQTNFDTLRMVQDHLQTATEALYKDFNAFDVLKLLDTPELDAALQKQLVTIMAKQQAYDILSPVLEAVDIAVRAIKNK